MTSGTAAIEGLELGSTQKEMATGESLLRLGGKR